MNTLKVLSYCLGNATLVAVCLGLVAPRGTVAQTANDAFSNPLDPERSNSLFNSGASGSPTRGVMDLIHHSVLAPSRSIEEFGAIQRDNLDSEAADFMKRRQEQLRQQSQGGSAASTGLPRVRFTSPAQEAAPEPGAKPEAVTNSTGEPKLVEAQN